jgi:hypothetical protein
MMGLEALHQMGYPRKLLQAILNEFPDMDDAFYHDVAGNTFPGNITFAVFSQITANLQDAHFDQEDDLERELEPEVSDKPPEVYGGTDLHKLLLC